MGRYLTIIILFLCWVAYAEANLPAPPIIKDVQLGQYLKSLYDSHNVVEIVTTAPNGNRNGKVGDIVVYNNAGVYTLWVNTDGGTAWSSL